MMKVKQRGRLVNHLLGETPTGGTCTVFLALTVSVVGPWLTGFLLAIWALEPKSQCTIPTQASTTLQNLVKGKWPQPLLPH